MTMFMSTISGKIDAKGRVSVPSVFRSAISAQNGAAQSGAPQGIFVYPSFTENAIEGGGHTLMNDIGAMVERLNLFAEERDALAASLFADSHHLNFDADGPGFPSGRFAGACRYRKRTVFCRHGRQIPDLESARFCRFQIEILRHGA